MRTSKQKIKHLFIFKSGLLALIMFGCFISIITAQETNVNTLFSETQADKDWEELRNTISDWSTVGTPEEQKAYGKTGSSSFENFRFLDKYFQKNSSLAEKFWNNYPQDKRRKNALHLFFHPVFEPFFISKVISDSLIKVLVTIPRKESVKMKRMIPIDNVAIERWRKKGNDMVAAVLASNASIEDKEVVERQLIYREYRTALRRYHSLPKEVSEASYWEQFDKHYWDHIRLRLEAHVNKYAALETVSQPVQSVLNLLNAQSPYIAQAYWKYFFDTTGADSPLSDKAGIKALHKLAAENVAAIEALKEVDYTKPLEMKFTAMDGSEVDLAKMRGKVVLIDFWATYCSPCIKEMPHVRALYDKYRNQGFEVIGIAADGDANRERVLDILKKSNANWPQRLDKGADASVSFHALYKIKSLPTVWLLNKEGVIVDRNARGQRLEPLIRKYLGLEE